MTRRRTDRLRLVLAAVVALVVVVAVLAFSYLGRVAEPADRAARLVPADVLVYVHASTDTDREQDRRLLALAERFPISKALRARVEGAMSTRRGAFDLRRDLRTWLGDELAVALTPGGVMVLFDVADEDKANGVLSRLTGSKPAVRRRGIVVRRFEGGAAAFVGRFLVLGPEPLVNEAIDLNRSPRESLLRRKDYRRAADERPDERVLEAWVSPKGVTSVVAPRVRALALSANALLATAHPVDGGLRVDVRQLGTGEEAARFEPKGLESVPADALAYVGLHDLEPVARLLPRTARSAATELGRALRPLVDALDREISLSVSPASPEPILTLSARTSRAETAREALGTLQGVISSLLAGSEDLTGQVPTFEERDLGDGQSAYALRLAGGGELVYAVNGDRVIVSNSEDGVRRALAGGDALEHDGRFKRTVTDVPDEPNSLVFLDLSQLLALGDDAGLDASPAYRAARDDLRRIRALGAVVQRQGTDTTAELNLQIP